ncbi:MAG: hypothetical protein AB1847_03145 [bacterium]
MTNAKLKAGLIVIVFLLLLGLDAPEFIICNYSIPDEIYDIPRVLTDGNQLHAEFHSEKIQILKGMLILSPSFDKRGSYLIADKKRISPGYSQECLYCAAEIRRHDLQWNGSYQQDLKQEKLSLVKVKSLLTMFAEKSDRISSLLLTPSFPVLRI